jgi:hypothetical protein
LLLRGKVNSTPPGKFSGKACLSALNHFWKGISSGNPSQPHEKKSAIPVDLNNGIFSSELRGVIRAVNSIRQRILANALLRGWTKLSVWVLVGLLTVAMVSSRLAGSLLLVAILATLGAVLISIWTWRTRLSHYEAARRLDSATGLKDRLSTAIYFGGIERPDGMIGQQRKDAIARFGNVDPRGLFPVRMPSNVGRALALILVVAGLFAYRVHHKPPLVSLLQSTARSHLVQSILAPLVQAMQKDLQRTMGLVTTKPDAAAEEARRSDPSSSDDLWKGSDDKGNGSKDEQQESAQAGEDSQDQVQAPGGQETAPTAEAREQEGDPQSDSKNGGDSATGKSQQASDSQGADSRQSLGQSLMQALKNLLSNSPNQQANNRANQPPSKQGTPQSGNSHQPGATESDKRGESRGSSDAKQKATQTASEGAGSQQGSKELRKDQEAHPVNAVPDRVALEASGFKQQTRMNVQTETGTAQLATRDQSAQGDAAVNGAEQENIPARYRLYIQRYFEHSDSAAH